MFIGILEQSLIFLPAALGVYLSYAVLQRADLTVDGSFILGAGTFARMTTAGLPLPLCIAGAVVAGNLAGLMTACLQYRERVSPLIAGILALFILQSLTLCVMGRPNISLLGKPSLLEPGYRPLTLSLMGIGVAGSCTLVLSSRYGMLLRAFGMNATLLQRLGYRSEYLRMLGLALSNGLVAFAGCMTAQFNGYADLGMGTGVVLMGLGTVLIGKQLERVVARAALRSFSIQLACCFAGVLSYFVVVNGLISLGVQPNYLKMAIGIALAVLLLASPKQSILRGA